MHFFYWVCTRITFYRFLIDLFFNFGLRIKPKKGIRIKPKLYLKLKLNYTQKIKTKKKNNFFPTKKNAIKKFFFPKVNILKRKLSLSFRNSSNLPKMSLIAFDKPKNRPSKDRDFFSNANQNEEEKKKIYLNI